MKILALMVFLLAGTILWACCMAAATSDEQAEKLYQNYLRYKKRREKEENLMGCHPSRNPPRFEPHEEVVEFEMNEIEIEWKTEEKEEEMNGRKED